MNIIFSTLFLIATVAATALGGYTIQNFQKTSYGYAINLLSQDNGVDFPSLRADIITAEISLSRDINIARIRILPTGSYNVSAPFVIPDQIYRDSSNPSNSYTAPATLPYQVFVTGNSVVIGQGAGKVLFQADFTTLAYKNQFVNFTYTYPAQCIVSGYMERNYQYFLGTDGQPVTLSLWNTDNGTPYKNPMYGNYPIFWFNSASDNTYFAVLNMNAHAQQATVDPTHSTINLINLGGIIDLHVFFSGPENTALEVVQAYQMYVGPAAVPPYWSLGTHQCRWGYKNLDELKAVPVGYAQAGIPLEVLWNDIDYMDNFKVFTVDPIRYAGLAGYVDELHNMGLKYIQIVDPGVAASLNYSVYASGAQEDIFMKIENKTMVGVVWPGWTAFPDFTSTKGRDWWSQQVMNYVTNQIPIDGMWTDMNELSSFCGGSCPVAPGTPWQVDWETVNWDTFNQDVCIKNNCSVLNTPLNYPPFNPLTNGNQLFTKTPDMSAQTSMGSYFDTKMFTCNLENQATSAGLQLANENVRPFILTRSTFVGAGRDTFHWLGDNSAEWTSAFGGMVASIGGNQASNLGGIFMVGADIPGFGGPNSTEELAVRWYQLGSYYTFMRNHRTLGAYHQEPYLFSKTAQASFIQAINRRYRMLPYIFTCLMKGTFEGTPVTMHPSLVFSDQAGLYQETTAFMVGTNLLVVPAVTEGSNEATGLIPAGLWYALADEDSSQVATLTGTGAMQSFTVELYDPIPSFQLAGTMIPMHNQAKMLINDTKASGYSLVFALDSNGNAKGSLMLDTNEQPLIASNTYWLDYSASGTMSNGTITMRINSASAPNFPELSFAPKIVILFPSAGNLQTGKMTATLNRNVDVTISSPVSGKFIIYPATNLCDFEVIQWSAEVLPNKSDDGPEWKRNLIISASVIGTALVAALVLVLYLMKRKSADAGESRPLNGEI